MKGFVYTLIVIIFMLILSSVGGITKPSVRIQDDELNGDVLYLLGVDPNEAYITVGPPRDATQWLTIARMYSSETGEAVPGPTACLRGLCFSREDWTSERIKVEGRFEVVSGDCPINGTYIITKGCTLRIKDY